MRKKNQNNVFQKCHLLSGNRTQSTNSPMKRFFFNYYLYSLNALLAKKWAIIQWFFSP